MKLNIIILNDILKIDYTGQTFYVPKSNLSYILKENIIEIECLNKFKYSSEFNTVTIDGQVLTDNNKDDLLKKLSPSSNGGSSGEMIDTSNFLLKNDSGVNQGSSLITTDTIKFDSDKIEIHALSGGSISLHSEGNTTVLSTGNITQTTSATNTTIGNSIINIAPGQSLVLNSTGLTLNNEAIPRIQGGNKLIVISQADYDLITTKDSNTLYFITA